MSLSNVLIRNLLWLTPKRHVSRERIKAHYIGADPEPYAPVTRGLERICEITREVTDGQTVITLTPKGAAPTGQIIYLHGGAYVNPIRKAHWNMIAGLIRRTGARVTVPLYARAPQSDYRPATALVMALCDEMGGQPFALAGDSAGGNFVMSVTLRRRDAGLSMPSACVLFSPWLDLTLADPAARALEPRDPMLAVEGLRLGGEWWAGDQDPAGPYFSPLHADLSNLPPISVFQGDQDIFLPDTRNFVAKLREQGTPIDYTEAKGGFHVYMGATFTPEARAALDKAGRFITASLPLAG